MNTGLGEGVIRSSDPFHCLTFKSFAFMCFFFSIASECKALILGKHVDCCKAPETAHGTRIVRSGKDKPFEHNATPQYEALLLGFASLKHSPRRTRFALPQDLGSENFNKQHSDQKLVETLLSTFHGSAPKPYNQCDSCSTPVDPATTESTLQTLHVPKVFGSGPSIHHSPLGSQRRRFNAANAIG